MGIKNINLIIIIMIQSISSFTQCQGMKTYTFFTEFFEQDVTKVESTAYKLLKKEPLEQDVNYVAIPWRSWRAIKGQKNKISEINLGGGFTVCYDTVTFLKKIFLLLKQMGIDCIFTPCATISKPVIDGIRIEPFPYYTVNGVNPAPVKDILYSFIGWNCNPIRKQIFSMAHPQSTVIKENNKWFLSKPNQSIDLNFQKVLARSRFSLCPVGREPSSIRFWESLQAGAIPILISDDIRLPDGFDWDSAIVRVAERDVELIPEIIQKISPEQEDKMRTACIEAHKQFSGENFVSVIRNYYGKK